MPLVDYLVLLWAVVLLSIGLILEASGFGIFVMGRPEGGLLVVIGLAMFWAGWVLSGAHGFSYVIAAILNMFDAASTFAFWNFERNPIVLASGPTVFIVAKITCSLAIVLYAKLAANSKGGMVLAAFFAFIVAWNLSQHTIISLGVQDVGYGILFGSALSFTASAIVLYVIFRSERLARKP